MTNKKFTRRKFLGSTAKAGMFGALSSLGIADSAYAAMNDYKALVCVFLAGGNDGNNLVVPLDAVRYPKYQKIRSSAGIALTASNNTLLATRTAQLQAVANPVMQPFAFHYGLPEIDALYQRGQVAVVLNTGNLRQPLTKTDYSSGIGIPPQLFSHPDQTQQNQAGTPSSPGTGWGGRLVDLLGTGGSLDAISLGAGGLFVEGATVHGNAIPAYGQLALNGMNFWPQSAADARKAALQQILRADTGNVVANAANKSLAQGIDLVATLQSATAGGAVQTPFPGTSLGNELKTVAQLIRMRMPKGPGRQVYYVALGGFDTHGGQAYQQWDMLRQVSQAMAAFQAALLEIGAANNVTSFTLSEFGRSLEPSSSGTDHGWGNHHLVVGAAVKGGVYGQFPDFTLGGPDDATGRGVWIPQFSNQQFGATLGRWFGATQTQLDTQVFKNELANFARRDIGFMG
jgi:uncharacterized protein (DUF1501 family)